MASYTLVFDAKYQDLQLYATDYKNTQYFYPQL